MPRGERHHQILIEWLDERMFDERGVEGFRDRCAGGSSAPNASSASPLLPSRRSCRLADRQAR